MMISTQALQNEMGINVFPVTTNVYTVSQMNEQARNLLENEIGAVWIEGEVSNISSPRSGHVYFTLKDAHAQMRCVMFCYVQKSLPLTLRCGLQVLVRGRVSLYVQRGDFQLIVDKVREAGDGIEHEAFERLKQQLAKEGLFNQQYKKLLPLNPSRIGVITSGSGAARHDILTVLARRAPHIPVVIYPCTVQGDQAVGEIVQAIARANQHAACDVLIVARGGGSLEDLMPFNTREVAYAIWGGTIPVITGIGHEINISIADFVADRRAATPSAAAEQASPNTVLWQEQLNDLKQRFIMGIRRQLDARWQHLTWVQQSLESPQQRLQHQAQQLDWLKDRLIKACYYQCSHHQQHLDHLQQHLENINPYHVLQRGYALVSHEGCHQQLVTGVNQVEVGDRLSIRWHDGQRWCCVLDK